MQNVTKPNTRLYQNDFNLSEKKQKIKVFLKNNITQLIEVNTISDLNDLPNKYDFWEYCHD